MLSRNEKEKSPVFELLELCRTLILVKDTTVWYTRNANNDEDFWNALCIQSRLHTKERYCSRDCRSAKHAFSPLQHVRRGDTPSRSVSLRQPEK